MLQDYWFKPLAWLRWSLAIQVSRKGGHTSIHLGATKIKLWHNFCSLRSTTIKWGTSGSCKFWVTNSRNQAKIREQTHRWRPWPILQFLVDRRAMYAGAWEDCTQISSKKKSWTSVHWKGKILLKCDIAWHVETVKTMFHYFRARVWSISMDRCQRMPLK